MIRIKTKTGDIFMMAKRFVSYVNSFDARTSEKSKGNFTSYIDSTDGVEEDLEKGSRDVNIQNSSIFYDEVLQPQLLPGERTIAEAMSTLLFEPFSDDNKGMSGTLFVTNFKVAFVTADKSAYLCKEVKHQQRNKLIADNDIPLTCIESVYQVISGGKRRLLSLGQVVGNSSKYLEIHCKDFRILKFGFKFVPKDQNRQLVNSILHHASPTRDNLLFAYEFCVAAEVKETKEQTHFFSCSDWEEELSRHGCLGRWRVADVNHLFRISTSMPEYFAVPNCLTNADVTKAAEQYRQGRLPAWSYTYSPNLASMVRMSQLHPASDFKEVGNMMLMAVQLATNSSERLKVVDLTYVLSLADLQASIQRLMALCMTNSSKDFYSFDSTWLSRLDSTHWLKHIATCLSIAADVATGIRDKAQSFALQDASGTDLCCIISCLVQIILDPHCRTQSGFTALLHREWVVMGHPFQRRGRLVHDTDSDKAPVFLLFLDCVWQLLQQYPSQVAFSETFLTSLWDTVHLGLFGTFIFDSVWQHMRFLNSVRLRDAAARLPSAWNFDLQFGADDLRLFKNPLYMSNAHKPGRVLADGQVNNQPIKMFHATRSLDRRETTANTLAKENDPCSNSYLLKMAASGTCLLPLRTSMCSIMLWSQCYLRWSLPSQILGGGEPARYLQQCLLVEEILCLEHKLKQLLKQNADLKVAGAFAHRPNSGLVFSRKHLRSVGFNSTELTSSFPFPASINSQTQHKLISGPLTLYLHNSLLSDSFANAED